MENLKNRKLGVIMALTSTILWGISGNVTQYMFEISTVSAITIVTLRLLISGFILILYALSLGYYKKFIELFKDKDGVKKIIIFSIFGMLATQLSFFSAIENSNAAIATLLQFVAPIIVIIYYVITSKKAPTLIEIIATLMAIIGTFLIITNGSFKGLSISFIGLFWGFLSAFALSFYMIYAKNLFKWSSKLTVGLCMMIGGVIMFIFLPNKNIIHYFTDMRVILAFGFNIIFGTVLAFYLFIESLRYISPKETSILSSCEPLTALIISTLFLNVSFGFYQVIGSILIILMIIILSFSKSKNTN